MPTLELNCYDPTDPRKPFKKQVEFLSLPRKGRDTARDHWVGGRGSAKTTTGILLAVKAAFEWMPGLTGCWTEPTYSLCRDVFLAEWDRVVPHELYRLNKSEMVIECVNKSRIFIRSRNVDNAQREVIKGINLAWCIDDEAAYKYDEKKYWDIDAAIRVDTPYKFHDTLTTPKLNEYYNLIHDDNGNVRQGHNLVTATSFDNPHLPENFAKNLTEQMDAKYADQEIYGRWISLKGRIWDNWSDEEWPNGNIHVHRHDYNRHYYLFFDIGVASSAWAIVQKISPTYHNGFHPNYHSGDSLWVVTAEYTPAREEGGSVTKILPQIKQEFGTPVWVVCGHDLNRRSDVDGTTAHMIIQNHFGAVPITIVGEGGNWHSDKELQGMQLRYGILDTKGRRRFCVSKYLKKFNAKTNRGILEVMKQDTWPTISEQVKAQYAYPKDGRLEHMRDSIMYGAVSKMFPPAMEYKKAYAA